MNFPFGFEEVNRVWSKEDSILIPSVCWTFPIFFSVICSTVFKNLASVSESLEIFNLIRSHKGNTEARITGVAASAMSYIILAADKVTAHENAVFMIHNAWNLAIGDHNDMRKVAATLESLSNIYVILSKNYQISAKVLHKPYILWRMQHSVHFQFFLCKVPLF